METRGGRGLSTAARYLTPLMSYGRNHTTNPITLYNRIVSAPPLDVSKFDLPNLRSIDDLVDKKRDEIKARWERIRACERTHREGAEVKKRNPNLYEYRQRLGWYDCDPNESWMPKYESGTYGNRDVQSANGAYGSCSIAASDSLHKREDVLDYSPYSGATPSPRFTTEGTTAPTITSCSSPIPPCFDICCIVRSSLILIVHIIEMLARFFNGIIQGNAALQGTLQDFPYFTGEFANYGQPTFETDLVALVLDLFVPIYCACSVLNLIIPITPTAFTQGRPDICCAILRLSDLVAAIFQVIINAINALAMGGTTNYVYFTMGFFKSDVNVLFDISLDVVCCLCILVRAIFPLDYIPGFATATNFDICCIGQVLLDTLIEIARTLLQVIISLATITVDPSSFCYWRLDKTLDHDCSGTLDGIGIIKQLDVVIDTFLPRHGENGGACFLVCHSDDGATGIVPCICQILNTLVPFRPHPELATNCNASNPNCPILDLCCPFAKLGFAIGDSLKFINRGVAAFWQSWATGLPEFFVAYIWCAEPTVSPCSVFANPITGTGQSTQISIVTACMLQANVQIPVCQGTYPVELPNHTWTTRCGAFTCGKVDIIISDLTDPFDGLLSKCTCQLFSLLDELLVFVFNYVNLVFPQAGWSCCFCGGAYIDHTTHMRMCNVNNATACGSTPFDSGSGVLPAISYIIDAVLRALTNLARQFPFNCYWRPFYPQVPSIIDQTWVFSFLGPTADALAIASGNLFCFAESMFLLPTRCLPRGEKFLGGLVRWLAEVVLRVVGFIEAFIESFINIPNTCVGPNCDQTKGKQQSAMGVQAKPLGNMMVILLSIPIDLLIGDADISCTSICPSIIGNYAP